MSEVCRRHALEVSVFYRWRAVAQGSVRHARNDPEARHKADMEHLRAVIAEITAENLELKKTI